MENIQAVISQQAGTITCNFEQVESALNERLQEYEGAVFTEESKQIAKKIVASLRAEKKGFQDNLRDAKRTYMTPWDTFEARAKSLISMYDKPINLIDGQVKAFEEKRVEEKRQLIKSVFTELVGDMVEILPFDRVSNPKWENATYKEKDIRKDIAVIVAEAKQAIETIRMMHSEAENQAISIYRKSLNLSEAMTYISQYEQQKRDILAREQERQRREEERRHQEEVERARREERERVAKEQVIRQEAEREALEAVSSVDEQAAAPLNLPESQKYVYTIVATPAELQEIEMALDSIGVYYERKEL